MTTQISTIAASSQATAEETKILLSTLDSSQAEINDNRTSLLLKNANVQDVEVPKDKPNSGSAKLSSSQPTKTLSAIPMSTIRAQSLRPELPYVKVIHTPSVTLARSVSYDVEDTSPNATTVGLSEMQCVDNSTQTDSMGNNGQIFLRNNLADQFEVQTKVKGACSEKENRKQSSILNEIVKNEVLAITLDRKNECDSEKNMMDDENYIIFRDMDFEDMKSVCGGSDETSSEIKSLIKCDNSFSKPIRVLEIEQSSINSENVFECKTHSSSESFLESAECTCNAAKKFNCDCDQTLENCTYQERIIDYDNFRIIEHVIDCGHESSCKHSEKMKCDTPWKEAEGKNMEKNKDMNLSCRELVAFIGESYQIINNEHHLQIQNQEQNDKNIHRESLLISDTDHSSNNNDKKDILFSGGVVIDHLILESQSENTNLDENLDNNNNKGYSKRITQILNGSKNLPIDSNMQILTTFGTTNSVSTESHVQSEPSKRNKQQSVSTVKNSTSSMSLALKALKSKLTPLAPSFHPSQKKLLPNSSKTTASSSMYAYEQTAIYYQQEPQQPKPQLPCLQQSATTTTVHKTNFHQYQQLQDEQQHQLQVVPMVQSSYSKNYFQRQYNPSSLVQNLQQAHNFVTSSNEHFQHNEGLVNSPQSHLPSVHSTSTVAIPTSVLPMTVANPTQQASIYPVQLISLTTPSVAVDASNTIGQPPQACTTSTAVSNGSTPWPPLEAAPVFIDSHGEFHAFCPTHGHAALNTVSVETVASPQCVPFNQTTLSSTRSSISQSSQSKYYQNSLQHQTRTQSLTTAPVQNAKVKIQNHNQTQNSQLRHQQQPHYHQQQQKFDSGIILNISGRGKLFRGK